MDLADAWDERGVATSAIHLGAVEVAAPRDAGARVGAQHAGFRREAAREEERVELARELVHEDARARAASGRQARKRGHCRVCVYGRDSCLCLYLSL
eukprot:6199585-Pleurochrysis_carterae.AAC.6